MNVLLKIVQGIFISRTDFLYPILFFFFYNIPMLEVYISENTFTNKKKPYIFRSRNLVTYTQEDIIQEIGMSGTTFPAADAAGFLRNWKKFLLNILKAEWR